MANKAVGWAWDQATDRPIDKSILVALADYAGADGYSYPSHREIGSMVQCSPDSVQRALKRLIARGLIKCERRFRDNGGKSSNGYVVLYLGPDSDKYRQLDGEAIGAADGGGGIPQNAAWGMPQNAVGGIPQNAAWGMPQNAVGGIPQNAASHAAPVRHGHTATVRHDKNPSLDPSIEKNARAGACEAGASPARAEEGTTAAEVPVEATAWVPGRPCLVRPSSPGWAKWLEAIGLDAARSVEDTGAAAIVVTAPWPGKDSRLIGLLMPDGAIARAGGGA